MTAKALAGSMVAALLPQCRPDRALRVVGHMRCGSTALSNILVSRPEVSGYGEAHVAYTDAGAQGVLLLNQWRRGSWRPDARWLFDKVLHDRYDAAAWSGYFVGRAIFVARRPAASIASIRALFAGLASREYGSDAEAADYYEGRLTHMLALWPRFPAEHRVALTYEGLIAAPEAALAAVGALIGVPLANHYRAPAAARGRGAGDPEVAPRHARIDAAAQRQGDAARLDLPADRLAGLEALYQRYVTLTAAAVAPVAVAAAANL